MATYATRPAWDLRARALSGARIAVPLGPGGARRSLSIYVRTRELGAGFWIDEGLSVGIADRPLTDIPGVLRQDGSPPLYYVLLQPVAAAGGRLGGGAPTRSRWSSPCSACPSRGGAGGCCFGAAHGLDGRRARRRQPVPHAVRAGDAHVRAGGPARPRGARVLAAGVRRRPAGGRRRAPRRGARASRSPSRRALHAQLGAVLRPRHGRGRGSSLLALAPPRERRRLLRTALLGLRRRARCSTSRGSRRSSTRPPTRARRGRTRPTSPTSPRRPPRCWGRRPRSRSRSPPAPGCVAILARAGARAAGRRGRRAW